MTKTLKPCPLAEALELTQVHYSSEENADALRAELAKRGYAITRAPDDELAILRAEVTRLRQINAGNEVATVAGIVAWLEFTFDPASWNPDAPVRVIFEKLKSGDWKDKDDG